MNAIMTIEFEKIVTNHGLNLPSDISEQDFFKVGDTLNQIVLGSQWAIGDWYNAIPWGDKEKACKRVDLNYKNAQRCGEVADYFEMPLRGGISFSHHKVLAISDLTKEQRNDLLEQAEDKKWTVKVLTKARDKVLGTWIEPAGKPDGLDEIIDAVADEVPEKYRKQCKKAMVKAEDRLVKDFNKVVIKQVKEKTKEFIDDAKEAKEKAEASLQNWEQSLKKINHIFTLKEFQAIRSALHPDKHPGEDNALYANLFKVFNKLKDNVDRNPKAKWVET